MRASSPSVAAVVIVVVTGIVVAATSGCAPRAGFLRPEHPMLLDESGRDALVLPKNGAVVFDDPIPDDDGNARAARARIAQIAGESVGHGPLVVDGARYRMDCSGVASGIYARAGFVLTHASDNGGLDVRALFALVKKTGSLRRNKPLPGDFAFFDDTYDANNNGLRDDPLSHVGVVERVDDDGTVVFVQRIGAAIVRARMNLDEPHLRHDKSGHVLNHYLRLAEGAVPAKTTAELFVAYGSLPLREPAVVAAR